MTRARIALLSLPAVALLAVTTPASAATTAASWQLNERSGQMLDSSGNGNNSASVGAGISRTGSVYAFTGKGRVVVPNAPSLIPGSRSFTITARLHLTAIADQNFVQKNTYSTSGTQLKLEASGKHLHCRVAGNSGVASVWGWNAAPTLLSGYHTISCSKTATSVTLRMDGTSWTQKISVGSVTTTAPMTIGGKYPCKSDCDFTTGDIDWVTYTYP
jgi:hypothetical protein